MGVTREIAKKVLSYFPFRYVNVGREFHSWLNKFERMEQMTYEQIREEQFESLRRIVTLAYDQTPFYKHLYDENDFHPTMLRSWEDVERIPVIRKEAVRAYGRDMIVSQYRPQKLKQLGTSGTTGTSLVLYSNRAVEQREWAAICYQWAGVGYKPGDGRVEFRGALPNNKAYLADPYHRTLRINTTAIHASNIKEIVEVICQSGYAFLYGFPSALSMFSKLVSDHHLIGIYKPRAVLLACEVVHDYQMNCIQHVFQDASIFAHYGQTEKIALGGWKDSSNSYYFLPLYSYVEHNPQTKAIIGTSFVNDVMPLIRYELTDEAAGFEPQPRPEQSHLFPVVPAIDGRMGEIMYKPNGDWLSSSLVAIALRGTKTFSACKMIQHQYDLIELVVESIASEERVMEELKIVTAKLEQLFSSEMNFKLSIVPHIPRSATGKFKSVEVRIVKESVIV